MQHRLALVNLYTLLRQVLVGVLAMVFLLFSPVSKAGVYDDFFNALLRNDAPAVSRLIGRGFDPNTTGPSGVVALHLAIMERSYAVAETLIQARGIQVDKRNNTDETALMLAALRGHMDLCRLLLGRGADVNKPGWTALHYAASGEQTEIVKLLLDHFAYIDAEAPSGNTPLMMAVMYGPESTIALLLEAGADPTLKNNAGRTAMDLAEGIKRQGAINLLKPGITRWRENEALEAQRMKKVEAQMALEELAELREEAQEGAATAVKNLRAAAKEASDLDEQAKLAAQNAPQITELPPLPSVVPLPALAPLK